VKDEEEEDLHLHRRWLCTDWLAEIAKWPTYRRHYRTFDSAPAVEVDRGRRNVHAACLEMQSVLRRGYCTNPFCQNLYSFCRVVESTIF
jgi:hypothetical protein